MRTLQFLWVFLILDFILFLFIYFWLNWVFVDVRRLPLVTASGGLLFTAVHGLLTAVASPVEEHRL